MSSETKGSVFAECPAPINDVREIQMGHGSGGKMSAQLVERILVPAFRNPMLEALSDQAMVPVSGRRVAFTTDSYVVTPIFFPGGDIGALAVNGTVNDLAMGGAIPRFLSLSLILEEGFPLSDLQRVVESIRAAAQVAEVQIVTGDTKVVNRGKADRIFINTAGIGDVPEGLDLGPHRVEEGDAILLSGTVGDHGVAILSQREGLTFDGPIESDTAPLQGLVRSLLAACPNVHCMRDPTRGGVAASVVEIATRQRLGMEIDESSVPMRDVVRGACELLGLDPMLIANEGKLVAFVPEQEADAALEAMKAHPLGRNAARIGRVTKKDSRLVTVRSGLGTERILDLPFGELLPRIC